jgi:DNA-binding transcriptional MerR regulator
MFSIGDFAKLGRVSIRMLRQYDDIGLLEPAHVDPLTGYRSYDAAQLRRLTGWLRSRISVSPCSRSR